MKIYTKGGDKGITSMLDGSRVPKNHPRLEVCGTYDELISWIGLLRDQEVLSEEAEFLTWIQDRLMVSSAQVAREEEGSFTLPELNESDVNSVEAEIDRLEEELPALRSFVIPGGHQVSSYAHIARNICRRTERLLVPFINADIQLQISLRLLNRLADYLFVLARYVLKLSGVEEIKWNA